jgi:hypothetical protein
MPAAVHTGVVLRDADHLAAASDRSPELSDPDGTRTASAATAVGRQDACTLPTSSAV